MAEAKAWLLPLDEQLLAATGEFEISQIITEPQLYPVPGAPAHCNRVCNWQNRLLPVLDLATWLRGNGSVMRDRSVVAIAAYREESDALPNYGGLLLAATPRQITVDDNQACPLPARPVNWPRIAISCFRHQDQAVPIIDLGTVFSEALLPSD